MSRGRSRDKTYTKDVPSTALKLKERGRLHAGATSLQDRLVAPSEVEMQRAVSNGECPFCGRDYQNIAVHTNRAHGVSGAELKDMMGIPRTHAVCTPEMSANQSDRMKKVCENDPGRMAKVRPKGNARKMSKAGRAVNMAKLEKARVAQAAQFATDGWCNRESYETRTAERDAAIADRVLNGATLAEVLKEFGVVRQTVMRALKRHGVEVNFRKVRFTRPNEAVYSPEFKARRREACAAARARLRDAKLARWGELGKTWEAVETLAREFGVSEKGMRGFLRRSGEFVADGRTVSPRRMGS